MPDWLVVWVLASGVKQGTKKIAARNRHVTAMEVRVLLLIFRLFLEISSKVCAMLQASSSEMRDKNGIVNQYNGADGFRRHLTCLSAVLKETFRIFDGA